MISKTKQFETEADLARVVVAWLKDSHWEVYQEVRLTRGGGIADIVATQGKLVQVVECKLSLNLDVIDQARRWNHLAHFVRVAVPSRTPKAGYNTLLTWMMVHFGIGHIAVSGPPDWARGRVGVAGVIGDVREKTKCRLNRTAATRDVLSSLHEEQKKSSAGTNCGGYWTPFRDTCRNIEIVVGANPGITFSDMMKGLKHHYCSDATARSCMRRWIEAGSLKEIVADGGGKAMRLYLKQHILKKKATR